MKKISTLLCISTFSLFLCTESHAMDLDDYYLRSKNEEPAFKFKGEKKTKQTSITEYDSSKGLKEANKHIKKIKFNTLEKPSFFGSQKNLNKIIVLDKKISDLDSRSSLIQMVKLKIANKFSELFFKNKKGDKKTDYAKERKKTLSNLSEIMKKCSLPKNKKYDNRKLLKDGIISNELFNKSPSELKSLYEKKNKKIWEKIGTQFKLNQIDIDQLMYKNNKRKNAQKYIAKIKNSLNNN